MTQLVCKVYLPKSKAIQQEDDKTPYMIKNKQELCDAVINLEIVKQISTCLLLNEWFDVEFSIAIDLVDRVAASDLSQQNSDATLRLQNCIELSAVLRPSEDSRSDKIGNSEYKLVVDTSTTSSLSFSKQPIATTNAKFRCKITGPATLKSNPLKLFRINIYHSNKVSLGELKQICTGPFHLVSHKLVLENYDWDDHWYKDEGGRDKCMHVQVGLYNSNGNPVYGERVNLTFTLLYDTQGPYSKVMKQDILQMLGPTTTHVISPNTAQAKIQFRINDVSKNHQGQSFTIQISCDPTMSNHVAPVYCPSVCVLSKRNKKQRVSKIATSTSPRTISPTFSHLPTQSPHLSTHFSLPSPQKNFRQTEYPHLSTNSESISRGLDRISDVTRLREAMRGVMTWSEEVVSGLNSLQWQPIGYAQFPDGTPNYNSPYHKMPNPNKTISKILSIYATSSRDQLSVLLNAVENNQDNQESDRPITCFIPSDSDESIRYQPTPNTTATKSPSSFVQGFCPKVPVKAPHMSSSCSTPSQFRFPAQNLTRDRNTVSGHCDQWQNHHQMSMPHQAPGSNIEQMSPMDMNPGHGHSWDILYNSTGNGAKQTNMGVNELQKGVAFIVAMQYISPKNGTSLGFPAYCVSKEVLGFYRESGGNTIAPMFIPISSLEYEFGPMEKIRVGLFYTETMQQNADAVYSIKDWGTVSNLVDQAMAYDWNINPLDDMIGSLF